MNIQKISINIPNLESIYKSLKKNPKGFFSIPEALDRVSMTITADCDMISMYFIKEISTKFNLIKEVVMTQNEVMKEFEVGPLKSSIKEYNSLMNAICTLISTRDSVYMDGYAENPTNFDIIMPILTLRYTVTATISNEAIHKIFGDRIESIICGKNDAMGNFIVPDELSKDDIEAICAWRFNHFISGKVTMFILNQRNEFSDIMDNDYFNVMKQENILKPAVSIAGIYGSSCNINFFNTTPEKLNAEIKESKKTCDIKTTLCVHSTFKDMCMLACQPGVRIVSVGNTQDFLKGGIDLNKLNEYTNNYKTRISKSVSELVTAIPKLLTLPQSMPKRVAARNIAYMSIFNGQMINSVLDVCMEPHHNPIALDASLTSDIEKCLTQSRKILNKLSSDES